MKKYLISCGMCGEHEINEELFMKFVPRDLREKAKQKISTGWTGVLEFKDQCPHCQLENGASAGEVRFRKLNIN